MSNPIYKVSESITVLMKLPQAIQKLWNNNL